VLPGTLPWLWVVRSPMRQTFSPSIFTFMDQEVKYTLPLFWLVSTPFFGAQPASSPMLFLK
jgi:hypothetical protein